MSTAIIRTAFPALLKRSGRAACFASVYLGRRAKLAILVQTHRTGRETNLRHSRVPFLRPGLISGIQGSLEPLALFHHQRVQIAIPGLAFCRSSLHRLGILEEQMIRDVLVARSPLLGQVVNPPQEFQNGTDQLLLLTDSFGLWNPLRAS